MSRMKIPTLGEAVYHKIRQMIFSGELKPDEKLNLENLAKQLEVSPTPIREALGKLEKEGLAVHKPRIGWRIAKPSRAEFIQLHDFQEILEQAILERALMNVDKIDFEHVRKINEHMAHFVATEQFDQVLGENEKFHLYLYEFCPNKILLETLSQVWDNLKWQRLIMISSKNYLNRYFMEHEEILVALESKELERVHQALKNHFKTGLSALEESLEE